MGIRKKFTFGGVANPASAHDQVLEYLEKQGIYKEDFSIDKLRIDGSELHVILISGNSAIIDAYKKSAMKNIDVTWKDHIAGLP